MNCECIGNNPDGSEALLQVHNMKAAGPEDMYRVKDAFSLYIGQNKSVQVERFKFGIAQVTKAIKFAEFEERE